MKVKIEFIDTVTVQDGTGTTYDKGQVESFEQTSADHWLTRGKAKPYVAPPVVKVKPHIAKAKK